MLGIGNAQSATDEAHVHAETDPSPPFRFAKRPSPTRGEGKSTCYAVIPNSFAAVRPKMSAFSSSLSVVHAKMWSTGAISQG